jgi:hypothetical protein
MTASGKGSSLKLFDLCYAGGGALQNFTDMLECHLVRVRERAFRPPRRASACRHRLSDQVLTITPYEIPSEVRIARMISSSGKLVCA